MIANSSQQTPVPEWRPRKMEHPDQELLELGQTQGRSSLLPITCGGHLTLEPWGPLTTQPWGPSHCGLASLQEVSLASVVWLLHVLGATTHPKVCLFNFPESCSQAMLLILSRECALSSVPVFLAPQTWVSIRQLDGLKNWQFESRFICWRNDLGQVTSCPWIPVFFSGKCRGSVIPKSF